MEQHITVGINRKIISIRADLRQTKQERKINSEKHILLGDKHHNDGQPS